MTKKVLARGDWPKTSPSCTNPGAQIPIFPGVAVPYCASGGHATVAWPCSGATAVLKPHLPLLESWYRVHRKPSGLSRSLPTRSERRGGAPGRLGAPRRVHRRLADRVGAAHARATAAEGPRNLAAIRAHRARRKPLRFEG